MTNRTVTVNEEEITVPEGADTIIIGKGEQAQIYVVDDYGDHGHRLVTESCWNSVFASAAGSSTNIV